MEINMSNMCKTNKKKVIEFLEGQKGSKGITAMERLEYDKTIIFIEKRENYFKILKAILNILFAGE